MTSAGTDLLGLSLDDELTEEEELVLPDEIILFEVYVSVRKAAMQLSIGQYNCVQLRHIASIVFPSDERANRDDFKYMYHKIDCLVIGRGWSWRVLSGRGGR